MPDPLVERFGQHDRRALARLISQAARGEKLPDGLPAPTRHSRVVAVTGSGGVGKSTLIGKLIEHFRERNLTVAVIACDPQSPLSGGALLGDRFRMPSRPADDGVFIRSLAAARGPLAEHLPAVIRLLEAFGFDLILLETVGAGQADTAVRHLADLLVLALQPETGDDLQWEKAGLMEVADVVAIHKADLPGAESAAAQVRSALDLSGARPVPVIRVSSKTGEGIDDLARTIADCPPRRSGNPGDARELLRIAQEELALRFIRAEKANDPRLAELAERWKRGELGLREALTELVRHLDT